ncbi:hypothetical protein M758_UG148600 [Ceratodon purpureus]|nr:hypothetical protein M758_UG148600 [Ceratodon purpureus]
MSHCRYQWRNFWKATGRGDKHEQCPKESFPALVTYWNTLESEEEERALELEMEQSYNQSGAQGLGADGAHAAVATPWNVTTAGDDDSVLWGSMDAPSQSETMTTPSQSVTYADIQSAAGATSSTPTPTYGTAQRREVSERSSLLGSPPHALFTAKTRTSVPNEESRIRRELQPLPSVIDNDKQWRECMERRMDSTASKVSSLGRKIEFLIDTLLSKGQRPDVRNDSTNPDSATPGITPNSRVELEAIGKGVRSLSGNGARTGSVSVVSHEIPSDGQPFPELGDGGDSISGKAVNEFSRTERNPDLAVGAADHALQQNSVYQAEKSPPAITAAYIPPHITHNAMQVAMGSFDDEILCTQRRAPISDSGESENEEPPLKKTCYGKHVTDATTSHMAHTDHNEFAGKGSAAESLIHVQGQARKAFLPARERSKRTTKRPSKYLDQAGPLHPKRYVWVMHPDHQNETVALGQSGPHWNSKKTKNVPNVSGVPWEPGMQLVTIEHVYPQWSHVIPMYPDKQRQGLQTMADAMNGEFAEDSTILWRTNYLNYVQAAKK